MSLDRQKAHPQHSRDIAYGIAGLLGTQFAAGLANNDPISEIMTLAGELELPEGQQGDATWDELRRLVQEL